MERYRKDTFGMLWDFQCGMDLTGYTELILDFRKPESGTVLSFSSALAEVDDTGTPTDGKMRFSVPEDMLDEKGTWQAVTNPLFTGKDLKPGTAYKFEVVDDFDPVST